MLNNYASAPKKRCDVASYPLNQEQIAEVGEGFFQVLTTKALNPDFLTAAAGGIIYIMGKYMQHTVAVREHAYRAVPYSA